MTAAKLLAGISRASLKPNWLALKVCVPSSEMVTVLSAPAGASFTGVTLTVKVFADSSKLLIAPLLSLTWKVKLA